MSAHAPRDPEAGNKTKRSNHDKRADFINRVVKTVIGGLIGAAMTSLFGVVVFAVVIKAFTTSEEMSFHLLNSAITLVGTALGAVLGYYLGRNSNDKPEQGP
jgi:uncharacterized membrane protein YgaE (UPF0421/DUF939 family)